jgi:hypothetical protein
LHKWIKAYEQIARENEQLRTQSTDTILLRQWQERYEECSKEREDLASKLKLLSNGHQKSTSGPQKSVEQLYIDLKDEYKVELVSSIS